jgi:transposase
LIAFATQHPDLALGFGDEVWWSRFAQPPLHSWCDHEPLRLVEPVPAKDDPDRKAFACYGVYLPFEDQMLLRFVAERPVSEITCQYLDWIAQHQATQGKRALILIWDNASWHTSQQVRQWIRAHNRRVKCEGGCRLLVFYLPSKSPWLNAIEPKWVHGKRAVVEPDRSLTTAELRQRICEYYDCEQLAPLAKSVC